MSEPTPRALRNFIGGEYLTPRSDLRSDVLDPSTGRVVASAPVSGREDIDLAYRAAEAAFPVWRDTIPATRQRALLGIADAIEARAEDLVRLESANTGKPHAQMTSDEIPSTVDHLRFFAGAARGLEGRSAGEYLEGHTSWIRREPIGVVGQVTPWNYPMMMAVWKFAPAIAAGNTVVLKPSDTTPETTLLLAELAAEFLPPGVLNVVTGDRDTGRALVAHPAPRLVAITGSARAGADVAAAASPGVKRVHLELGGKAPVIVFDDVDVEAVAAEIAAAGFFNAGQDCTSASRVLVADRVHDDFVAALAEHARNTRVGLPDDEEATVGAIVTSAQLQKVTGFLERLPGHAFVVAGGNRITALGGGFFHAPTVIDGLRQDDEAIQEEIFGPVITVQRFAGEEEALRLANDVRFGLASSVWTSDHGRAMRVSRLLDFGCVWINTHLSIVAEMPHGGFKHSGYGKDLSMYGIEDYTRIKHVMTAW